MRFKKCAPVQGVRADYQRSLQKIRKRSTRAIIRTIYHPFFYGVITRIVFGIVAFVLLTVPSVIIDLNVSLYSVDINSPLDLPLLSVVILTYKNSQLLDDLLQSIAKQKTDFPVEIIIADNGCFTETQNIVKAFFLDLSVKHNFILNYQYVPVCNNPGYAKGNNLAVENSVDEKSKWLLFLNDDVTLQGTDFLQHMIDLGVKQPNAGAVGCKVLSADGSTIVETASIVWKDGSCYGYGRGRKDINATDLSYPRPVDYVSGACLMIQHKSFSQYGGFNDAQFPNYYEDTDLQMHIQHDLGKEVWLQPLAIVHHNEHGTFGTKESQHLMQKASKVFKSKWRSALMRHLPPPFNLGSDQKIKTHMLQASDIRARKDGLSRIVYIDGELPNPKQGGGYGRAYDNVKMIAELGHMITVVTLLPNTDKWCNQICRLDLSQSGIELVNPGSAALMEEFLQSRVGLYDIVLVSRPSTFAWINEELARLYEKAPFAILYDSEALWFRRDEIYHDSVINEGIKYPSAEYLLGSSENEMLWKLLLGFQRKTELTLLSMADVVVTVAESESKLARQLAKPDPLQTLSIGHTMEQNNALIGPGFNDRKGILFVGAFHDGMYYNGDAIWYFVEKIYPIVLKSSSEPIHLTIAGRKIPQQLRDIVGNHTGITKHVTFLESPDDLSILYNNALVSLAPHLYGAGIQFKISEAFSHGIPVVMSDLSAKSFSITQDDEIACVGIDDKSFAQCIVSVHNDRIVWNKLRKNGLRYILETHNRDRLLNKWNRAIGLSMKKVEPWKKCNTMCSNFDEIAKQIGLSNHTCDEGENFYRWKYPDVVNGIEKGHIKSAFFHFNNYGKREGRIYTCNIAMLNLWKTQCRDGCYEHLSLHQHKLVTRAVKAKPKGKCMEGEALYILQHPDVGIAIKNGIFESAYQHWSRHGAAESRNYICRDML